MLTKMAFTLCADFRIDRAHLHQLTPGLPDAAIRVVEATCIRSSMRYGKEPALPNRAGLASRAPGARRGIQSAAIPQRTYESKFS
jgi:hypothetical protein